MAKRQTELAPVRIAAQEMRMVSIDELVPYERNAKRHSAAQLKQLRASLREFGFVAPVMIDENKNVIAGHGRLEAARAEGMREVPCVLASGLTDAQRRAYIIADNRLTELGEWNMDALRFEMSELSALHFDTSLTGFEMPPTERIEVNAYTRAKASDDHRERTPPDVEALTTEDGEPDEGYTEFVDKFKRKLTTDDCYTPPAVFEAVRAWAFEHYDLGDAPIVRPFYPNGDYQSADYPEGCVVLDNPPFSILSEICRFYMERGIRFFLFAPALTLFSIAAGECNYIATSYQVVYENGANVCTGFVTNLGKYKIETAPELYAAIAAAVASSTTSVELPAYTYPDTVAAPIRLAPMARYMHFAVKASECSFIRALDSQRAQGKAIYGGFLLSEKAAAEKAAAKTRDAYVWELSEREREIVAALG